jgi:hypothetical protein
MRVTFCRSTQRATSRMTAKPSSFIQEAISMTYRALTGVLILVTAASATGRGIPPTARSTPPTARSKPATASPASIAASRRITSAGENLKPFVVARPQGGVYLAWAQRLDKQTSVFFARSTDGSRYSAPVRLTPQEMHLDLGAESGPHVAVDPKGSIYVVWAAGAKAATPPPPAAGAGSATGHGSGHRHPPRPANLSIYLARSADDGKTFSAPRQVNDGPDGPEHRFPTVAVDSSGTLYVTWLDKRKESAERPGFSRAYFAKSTDGGRTFRPNLDVTGNPVDPICHCCKLAMAIHPTEGLFIAFRNDCSDLRDMFLVHSRDGGESFSPQAAMEQTRWMVPT